MSALAWRLLTAGDAARFDAFYPDVARAVAAFQAPAYEHGDADCKIPRNHVPRSYRLTCGGRVLALLRVRHMKDLNCLQVQEFFHLNEPAVLRECLNFLFTEATRTSGQTELRFAQRSRGETAPVPIPEAVARLAEEHGVELPAADAGIVPSEAGLELWLALAGFSPAARAALDRLRRAISPARVCFLLGQGVWNRIELEALLAAAPHPELILTGEVEVEDRLRQAAAFSCARTAVLAGACRQALACSYAECGREIERVELAAAEAYHPVTDCLSIRAGVPLRTSWWQTGLPASAPRSIAVAVRCRPPHELAAYWRGDLAAAAAQRDESGVEIAAVVYPGDYRQAPAEVRHELMAVARERAVALLAAPDTVALMQQEVRRRLRLARLVRS